MIINSNDIFDKIGLTSQKQSHHNNNNNNNKQSSILFQISFNQYQTHILQLKSSDNPSTISQQFCTQHGLNKLANTIIQNKIREVIQIQQQKNKNNHHKQSTTLQSSLSTYKKNKQIKQNYVDKNHKNNSNSTNISPIQSKTKKKLSSQAINGIYVRSIIKNKMLQEQKNKVKKLLEQKQNQKLTFKPKINNVSQKIVQFIRTNQIQKKKKPSPTPKYPISQQMKQCTFKPQINKVSQRIISNKSLIKQQRDNYNQIYKQKTSNKQNKQNKQRQILNDQSYSFHPQINAKSSQIIKIPFFQRLQLDQQKKFYHRNNQHYHQDHQCSFQPKVGRPPFKYRNKHNLSIWQHLHKHQKKPQQSLTRPKQPPNKKLQRQGQISKQYYDNLIQQTINKIFKILDSDNDGIISCKEIAIQDLPLQCVHFLKPIFIQIDSINATLNLQCFKNAVLQILDNSDPGTRGLFISFKWRKSSQYQQSFHPSINKKSRQILRNKSAQNIYKDRQKQKKNRQYRLDQERLIKLKKQMQQCTFKPILNQSSKQYIQKIYNKINHNKFQQINNTTSGMLFHLYCQNQSNYQQKEVKSIIIHEDSINDQ